MKYQVYKITNRVNGKIYIGYTKRGIDDRWKSHLSSARNGSPFRFHSAIRKYGDESWSLEVIEEFDTEEEAKLHEKESIRLYGSTENGYNATIGGTGGFVIPVDKIESWKTKIRINNSGSGNPNHSGMSDEFILECAIDIMNRFDIRGCKALIRKMNEIHGTPKHLKKDFRFVSYGGGERGLIEALSLKGISLKSYSMSQDNKNKLSSMYIGKRWYHNSVTGKNKQLYPDNAGDDWILGRI